jgi:hypothetical protein
MSFDI